MVEGASGLPGPMLTPPEKRGAESSKEEDCTSSCEAILKEVREQLAWNRVNGVAVGWEALYNLPQDSFIFESADLHYLWDGDVNDLLVEAVVISKQKMVVCPK